MAKGYLALVLHAHLPYVRPAARGPTAEEHWFFERARDCYLPLIGILDQLERDHVHSPLTISLSPTLIATMSERASNERLADHLDRMIELSSREMNRTALRPELHSLVGTYHLRLLQIRNTFADRCRGNLLHAFSDLASRGRVEFITGPASHAFLPGMVGMESQAIRCQIRLGLTSFQEALGHRPWGFWLPDLAYRPELDGLLGQEGVGYIIIDGRGLERASTPALHGVYAPIKCPSGVAAFGLDRRAADLTGSDPMLRPTAAPYRDNRRDIATELPAEYLRPYIAGDGAVQTTGFGYHRIGGDNGHPSVYEHKAALDLAARHAEDHMRDRIREVESTAGTMDRPPILISAHDMHVFGHQWFEGVEFLNYLLRKIHFDQNVIAAITPSAYLRRHPCSQEALPSACGAADGCGPDGLAGADRAMLYQHLRRAARLMRHLSTVVDRDRAGTESPVGSDRANGHSLASRALRVAGRQLVLAQSGDWPAMMRDGDPQQYGRNRLALHLSTFARVAGQIRRRRIDEHEIERLEQEWPVFSGIPTDAYR